MSDPITFEVLRNAYIAISNEMALVVAKSAYSPVVNEGRDFAGTVYTADGQLVSQGEMDLPAFVGLQMLTVPEIIRAIGKDNMKEGEAFCINDPYVCSTHCNDVHIVQPVFYKGKIVAFVSCTAHWTDVGGVAPGSLNGRARSHFEEGMRIPPVVIARDGEINRDVVSIFLLNMRDSQQRLGDIKAQLSALRIGNKRVLSLIEKYGCDTILENMNAILAYSEKLARASFGKIKDGTYDAVDTIDQDPATGIVKHVRLALKIEGDQATFDLTGTDPAAQMGINASIAATTSAVFIGLAGIVDKMPMNSGIMRAVKIVTTPGSLVHALPPSPVSGCAATSMESVIACVTKALSYALPEAGAATPFSIINSVFAGEDTREGFGGDFINYVWQFGGLGATKDADGASVVGSGYSASTQNIPVEILERRYPCFRRKQMFLDDSGGAGRKRGGLGCDMVLEFPVETAVSCIGNRERYGPEGLFGGESGQLSGLVLNKGTKRERNIGIFALNEKATTKDVLAYWSSGGGGYGYPWERDPTEVIEDIKDDYVTVESAKQKYGVVVKTINARALEYELDEKATKQARAKMVQKFEASKDKKANGNGVAPNGNDNNRRSKRAKN